MSVPWPEYVTPVKSEAGSEGAVSGPGVRGVAGLPNSFHEPAD